ncbi:cupredoxin domain-containing protein [Pedococcus sp. NPDC057267]|uniref:cupredoxin domain-containing protein n=1 Tax=Pedococcus sp. NPDC057267 TaxID=3346077 RepID=UPI003640A047
MTQHHPLTTRPGLRIGILALTAGCAIALSACGSSNSSSSSTTSSSSAGSSSAPSGAAEAGAAQTLAVSVKGSTVTPTPTTVELKVGQTLRLTVTSDHDDELHAHGFNQEVEIKAGKPVTLDLSTNVPGTYEVEMHHPSLRLLKVLVQ